MAGSRLNDRHRACQGKGRLGTAAEIGGVVQWGGGCSLGGALGRIKWSELPQSRPRCLSSEVREGGAGLLRSGPHQGSTVSCLNRASGRSCRHERLPDRGRR
jgi:hypothetical protein